MNELSKKKFQVKVTKVYKAWSFAIGLSNSDDETYILINFYKWHRNRKVVRIYNRLRGEQND